MTVTFESMPVGIIATFGIAMMMVGIAIGSTFTAVAATTIKAKHS